VLAIAPGASRPIPLSQPQKRERGIGLLAPWTVERWWAVGRAARGGKEEWWGGGQGTLIEVSRDSGVGTAGATEGSYGEGMGERAADESEGRAGKEHSSGTCGRMVTVIRQEYDRHMPPKKRWMPRDPYSSSEKLIQSFRIPRELVAFLKTEAEASGRDLTAQVNLLLDGVRSWFGLPEAATVLLEADRQALHMNRYEYLLHVCFQRSLDLREKGPGFDAPRKERR
jgi:hypothetical protein